MLSLVASIFVISIHSYTNPASSLNLGGFVVHLQNFISHGVARIAVPLFFSISGYLFFHNYHKKSIDYSELVSKKIRTLVIPYILCSLLSLAFYFILQTLSFTKAYFSHDLLPNHLIDLVSVVFLHPIPYQLWFLKDLMVLFILSGIVYTLLKQAKVYFIFALMIAWFFNLDYILFSNQALLFFALGGYICLFEQDKLLSGSVGGSGFFILAWTMLIAAKTFIMHNRTSYSLTADILHKFSILAGLVALWSSYDDVFKDKDPTKYKWYSITAVTFFIFLFHEPTLTIFKKVLFSLFGQTAFSHLAVYFIAPALTFLATLFSAILIKRHFPKLYRVICGGR